MKLPEDSGFRQGLEKRNVYMPKVVKLIPVENIRKGGAESL